ncbi:hypothetical protein CASFOL_004255 [Castilleja foliolosa]|uniref:Late embryogenesis abundant protein LEA-2 subgroup domain-containing protein n=1 Tax=Castilleja foliolosa TaxID=1961234 RepID=A0ABD3E9W2_9LAMI
MSQVAQNTPNDPPTVKCYNNKTILFLLVIKFVVILIALITLPILFWVTTHPTKPEFSITRAHVDRLNFTRPSTIDSSIHLTIRSYNPNGFTEIYYDEIFVHASYKGQKITSQAQLPQVYQDDHEETINQCAYLVGHQQIMGNENQTESDLRAGKLELNFEMSGTLRWRMGSSESEINLFSVNCVAIMPFGTSYVKGPFNCSTTL